MRAKATTNIVPEFPVRAVAATAAAVWVSPTTLRAWAKNPRKNDGEPVRLVAESIKRFGFSAPIIARTNGEVIAGHTRLKAALSLGLDTVPVRYMDLDAAEAHLLALADNKLAEEAEWDNDLLAGILAEYTPADAALAGWSADDTALLGALLADGSPDEVVEDDAPELPAVPSTKPGDLWLLGDHRVLCGDSAKPECVARLMDGKAFTVVFTDPPYGVSIAAKNATLNAADKSKSKRVTEAMAMDDMAAEDLGGALKTVFTLWRTVMANDCSVFVCSPQDGSLWMMMMTMMRASGLEVRHVINWVKNCATFSMGRLDYDYQHEPILFTWVKTHKRKKDGAFQTSVWAVDKPRRCDVHPTMKPVALPTCAILNHSDKHDIVGDPFLGSGTTLIAAEQTGRRCYGMEISPGYCDVIVKRWETLTGKKAVLA